MNPILALIIANIIWGAAAPIFKYALTDIPPFTLAFIRFAGATAIMLPFILRYNFAQVTKNQWRDIIVGAFFGISINISFLFLGLQIAPSINSSIIGASTPLIMFILSIVLLHEPVKKKVAGGMLVSCLGVLLIVVSPLVFAGQSLMGGAFIGNILYVVSRFGSVLGAISLKNTLKKVNPTVVTTVGFLVASILFLPFVPGELEHWSFVQLSLPGWVGIIYGIFFSSALAYYLFNYGLSKIAAEEIGVFMYIDPVVTVLVAAPLLHEMPDIWFALGSVFVFLGIYISEGHFHLHGSKKIPHAPIK